MSLAFWQSALVWGSFPIWAAAGIASDAERIKATTATIDFIACLHECPGISKHLGPAVGSAGALEGGERLDPMGARAATAPFGMELSRAYCSYRAALM